MIKFSNAFGRIEQFRVNWIFVLVVSINNEAVWGKVNLAPTGQYMDQ